MKRPVFTLQRSQLPKLPRVKVNEDILDRTVLYFRNRKHVYRSVGEGT
jgi:hypothetical protein